MCGEIKAIVVGLEQSNIRDSSWNNSLRNILLLQCCEWAPGREDMGYGKAFSFIHSSLCCVIFSAFAGRLIEQKD